MNINELEDKILNLLFDDKSSEGLSLEEILIQLALDITMDQIVLEILWQNIGKKRLTLTNRPERKFIKVKQ